MDTEFPLGLDENILGSDSGGVAHSSEHTQGRRIAGFHPLILCEFCFNETNKHFQF